MSGFKKMFVLPEDLVMNLNATAKSTLTPEMKTMAKINKEMEQVLNDPNLSDEVAMARYNSLLQRFVSLHRSQKSHHKPVINVHIPKMSLIKFCK